ncbi:MAG: zinc ribbon domain-containing protein [Candidatus Methanomethylicaceae archaeon]
MEYVRTSKSLREQTFPQPTLQKAPNNNRKGSSRRNRRKYLSRKETKNTSKTCHRCGHVAQVNGRFFKCPNCGMEYGRLERMCEYIP